MANRDVNADAANPLKYRSTSHTSPTVAALKTAISGSGVSASYPAATLLAMTKNDLIYVCRQNGIAVAGL